jgi:undecaprenyl diphosphate synthase
MTVTNLPKHVAIIMDGNGRWAKKRFMPRVAGHRAGVDAARETIKHCAKRNIQVLSLFAFSSENWRRPPEEVSYLMDLFLSGLKREISIMHELNIQLRFIGDRARFTDLLRSKIIEVEEATQDNQGMKLLIAADYGGQWDICTAMQKIAHEIELGKLKSVDVTPELISSKLSFAGLPDPDLFIRTSGEQRISNFMLWQLAYTELYFTPTFWPDFDVHELEKALSHYGIRERRFGYSSEQLSESACSGNA